MSLWLRQECIDHSNTTGLPRLRYLSSIWRGRDAAVTFRGASVTWRLTQAASYLTATGSRGGLPPWRGGRSCICHRRSTCCPGVTGLIVARTVGATARVDTAPRQAGAPTAMVLYCGPRRRPCAGRAERRPRADAALAGRRYRRCQHGASLGTYLWSVAWAARPWRPLAPVRASAPPGWGGHQRCAGRAPGSGHGPDGARGPRGIGGAAAGSTASPCRARPSIATSHPGAADFESSTACTRSRPGVPGASRSTLTTTCRPWRLLGRLQRRGRHLRLAAALAGPRRIAG